MTKRRAHNSILFLTTLSVYLGIVLVGGSPSVLAQAALTPRFELVNEFETEDDLDNKPDGDKAFTDDAAVRQEFVRLAEQLAAANPDRFAPDLSFLSDQDLVPRAPSRFATNLFEGRPVGPGVPSGWSSSSDDARFRASVARAFESIASKATSRSPELSGGPAAAFYLSLSAPHFADNVAITAVLKHTDDLLPRERIVVVTHLPRASIDDSPAEKR